MGPTKEVEEIPVYMFMGFLESGKTTFANETLIDRGFTEGEPTLLLVCEEGIEEYDEEYLKSQNIFVEYLEESNLNTEYLLDLQDKYKPTRVMIEYNGTWKMDKLFSIRVPKGWTIVQVITFVDASTFDVYVANMKAMMMEQLSSADMIIFNRCDENTKRAEYRRSIRAVNRRAQVIFENKDGAADVGDEELDLSQASHSKMKITVSSISMPATIQTNMSGSRSHSRRWYTSRRTTRQMNLYRVDLR